MYDRSVTRRWGWLPIGWALLAGSCTESTALVIDLKTDFVPGVEFTGVRAGVRDGASDTMLATAGLDYLTGQRVAELAGLAAGDVTVFVELLDFRGAIVAERAALVRFQGNDAVVIVISRDCRGVTCPGASDDPALAACLGGRCVDPRCLEAGADPARCGLAECATDGECAPAAACASGRCVSGVCLFDGDDARCDAGLYCNPDLGCVPLPGDGADGGLDGGAEDASMPTDAAISLDASGCDPTDEACDGDDDDCDLAIDEDFGVGAPCDGEDADACADGVVACDGPGATRCEDDPGASAETCDGADDDCDGATDEGFMVGVGCDGADADLCAEGAIECDGAGGARCSDATPDNAEPCNGADDDCDGMTDEGCACSAGATQPCGTDTGECVTGTQRCVAGAWGACEGGRGPAPETCDARDEDCDTLTDEGFPLGTACDGPDSDRCAEGVIVCDGSGGTACGDATGDALDLCEGTDDDCDPASPDGSEDPSLGGGCDGGDGDLCAEGVLECRAGAPACSDATATSAETCDGSDEDCDGTADEVCVTCAPSGWTLEMVEVSGDVGSWVDLATDGAGGLHASYYDGSGGDLRYAYHPPAGYWVPERVDGASANVGQYADALIDGDGGAHLLYRDQSNTDLRYAYRPRGGAWSFTVVDSSANVGNHASIAMDPSGGLHAAYRDDTNNDLRYAHKPRGMPWGTPITVQSTDNVGEQASIATDAMGDVYIAYRDATSHIVVSTPLR